MKKVFTLILALAFGFSLKAQTDLTQAVDFTATDIHGTEVHLFDILDSGQAVVIDFFYTTCSYCIQSIPYMVQSYQALGCNMHDVFYVEVDYGDSDQACLNWVNNHNVEYPTISGVGGGTSICSQYHIDYFPTVILIMPNRQIVIQDLYPIPNAQTVINQLEAHGIQQHDCNEPASCEAPSPNSFIASCDGLNMASLQWDASPDAQSYNVYRNGELLANVTSTNYDDSDLEYLTTYCYTITSLCDEGVESDPVGPSCVTPEQVLFALDTVYTVFDCIIEPGMLTITNMTSDTLQILGYEGEGLFVECQYDGNDIIGLNIPSTESVTIEVFADVPIKELFFGRLHIYTSFLEYEVVVICDFTIDVKEHEGAFPMEIYPNPANDFVTLKGEDLGMVRVFNVLGQMVDAFETNGSDLRINTTSYENGIYFVKAGETALGFVIKH
ncbi:MAG: redoxin domain-containing protein [Bacteroidales bacterium]|nr:redoxin domain-containing protein [Bacteroidales bacterium]